ncbi:uncharacterized protein LOC133188446 [Saccostrea echinata]|uniref:uncharacterized protein LOC133188446 n=1 Tax=Saccostrea echinata TaxID=191078 RepID=UPI002A7EEE87|nr:uncharacterized protein LOC133188446 [Saccostrea echinata]XP_061179864.1 uncharacterized protein LOC133188446 [Saccostrea echinata]XP_061179865.1 uncharacterized protein LOC133188446 [Saccostrea echinata]
MEIVDLPEEMLLLIFSYIPLYNLFFSVQKTCLAWRNLCFHHSLWTTVHYSKQIDDKLSKEELHLVLKYVARGLQHLVFEKPFQLKEMDFNFHKILQCILHEDIDLTNISTLKIPSIPKMYLEPLVEKCSNLSSVEVSYYYAYYNNGDFFENMKKLPHLKIFKITESSKSAEAIVEPAHHLQATFNAFLSDMFCTLTVLETVHIASVNKLMDSTLQALLKNCRNLKELALYGCDSISNAGFKALSEKSGITSLHLNSTSVTDKGMEHICRCCHNLQSVSFAGCMYVTDVSIKHLCTHCPNLESLCVADPEIFYHKSNITDGGLDYLSQYTGALQSLTMCNSAQISDLGLDQLARSCSKLTHLDVSGCLSVTDSTLQVLAQHCTFLQNVNFSECVHLTGKGINPLVVSCRWLQTLNVANCPFVENLDFEAFDLMESPYERYFKERDKLLISCGTLEMLENNLQNCDKIQQEVEFSPPRKNQARLNFLNTLSSSVPEPKIHSELRFLNIGLCSKITNQCLRQIATYCPDLRSLDINGCFNTSDLGISYIVKGCQSLEILNLSSGSMIQKMCQTDQSLELIATHCKCLRRLHIEKNPLMSLEGYKNLFNNCPLPFTVSLTTKSPEILRSDLLSVDSSNKTKRINVFSKGCFKGNLHQLDVLLYNSDGNILE